MPFNLGCGACGYCQTGHGNVRPDGRALGFEASAPGAFAERVAVPWADYDAVRVPDVDPTALAALGCRYVIAYHALERRAAVRAATDGGAHVSLDALGSSETARAGVESLRSLGTPVQVGLTGEADRGEISLSTDAMAGREITFHGARGMPPPRYDDLLWMLAADRLDPGALVARTVALGDVPDRPSAMDDYATAGVEVVTEF